MKRSARGLAFNVAVGGLLLVISLAGPIKLSAQISATNKPTVPQQLSLAQRLQQLEDEAEIRRRLDEYMDYLGARDWDGYVQFFAVDGALDMAEGVVTGRDAIHSRMANASARMAAVAEGQLQRQSADLLSNIRVQVKGDTATAQSRFTFLSEDADGYFAVRGSGLYRDDWVREDGSWKIQRRTVDWDLLAGQNVNSGY